jgi:quercetin dioxygenase-like cupin family protein
MEMKEIYSCDNYKVLQVVLNVGEKMPLHEASSDAFLICKKGKGRITFSDKIVDVCQNETLLIKANEPHQMEILEDFCSNIILGSTGKISFIKKESQPFPMSIY